MAENAMQGIMGLENAPQMANQAPAMAAPSMPEVTRDQFLAFERARQEVPPGDFTNDLLQAGEEIDPAAVQELRRDLTGLNLPLELILAMLTMVEGVLAEPGNYAQFRQELLAEGVPEDILPEQFDGEFFGALQLALEQMINMQPQTGQPIQTFAEGGLASLRPIAKELQSFGRNGDTILAHINPSEARMLQRMGGSGTINPVTGLREYFFKGAVKSIGNAFKSAGKAVGKAVKSVAKGVQKFAKSNVGKIVIAAALFYFAGPAAVSLGITSGVGAATFQGVVAGFGSSLLAGDNLKTSLRNGAIAGVTAGVGAGVMGGAEAFQAGSYTGAQSYGELFGDVKSGISNVFGGPPASGAEAFPVDLPGAVPSTTPTQPFNASSYTGPQQSLAPITRIDANTPLIPAPTTPTLTSPITPTVGAAPVAPPITADPGAAGFNADIMSRMSSNAPMPPPIGQQAEPSFFSRAREFISPSTPTAAEANKAGIKALAEANKTAASQGVTLPSDVQNNIFQEAAKGPSFLRQYGPIAAGGLGIMSLAGGFDEKDPGLQTSTYDRLKADLNPEDYEINLGGVETIRDTQTPYQDFYASMAQNPFAPRNPQAQNQFGGMPAPMRLAEGGQARAQNFPRKTGPINGPGTEKSDSIPAMLSDGEFVYTAKAVRGAGNGSRREGAKRMYQMMKEFERNA